MSGLYDLNGDGLPDRVMLCVTNTSSPTWLVYLNNGRGFETTPIVVTNIDAQGQSASQGWWAIQSSYVGNTYVTLMDINGDGLLDRVMNVYDSSLNDATTSSNYFYVQLNDGPFPDLLTSVSNGLGGVINVAYKPSTVWDNRKDPSNTNSYSTLPFPKQTVTTIIETDGINSPRTNTYSYAGGYYDGPRREFHGFAVVTNIDASLRKTITYYHQGGGRDYSALGEIAIRAASPRMAWLTVSNPMAPTLCSINWSSTRLTRPISALQLIRAISRSSLNRLTAIIRAAVRRGSPARNSFIPPPRRMPKSST